MEALPYAVSEDVLASNGKRLGNFLIDYVVQIALMMGFTFLIAIVSELTSSYGLYNLIVENDGFLLNYLIGAFILLLYYIITESLMYKSLGKFVTQTKVVMIDGSQPSFYDILIRTLCRLIPFDFLSFLGTKGKGWHDQLSKTHVVDIKKFEESKANFFEINQIGNTELIQ